MNIHVKAGLAGLSALASLLLSGNAGAADLASSKYRALPPAPPAFSWTGVYVGGQIGYSWNSDKTKEFYTVGRSYTGVTFDYHPDGAVGGALAGFNYQIGALVLGVEGDVEALSARGGFNDPGGRSPVDPGGLGRVKRDWQASVRGRIGYAFDRFIVYGTGGAAFTEFDYSFFNPVAGFGESTQVSKTGWTAGGGVDYALTNNLILGASYRYTDYGHFDYVARSAFLGLTGEQEPKMHTVRASLAYKF